MPGFDWIPGVSQVKSVCQLITGDVEGAAQTQLNFWKECPVASQITSTVQLIAGDTDGALETQKCCLGTVNNVANGIPVIGHAKGLVHHAFGDHDGGNQALNAATRTTVVLGSGAAAAVATGGVGAIPAGIAAGSAYDLVDSAINDTPKGIVGAVHNAVNKPNAGNIFDATAAFVGDGLTGYSGGQIGTKIANQVKVNNLEAARAAKTDQLNAGLFPEEGSASSMTSSQVQSLGQQINALTSEITRIRQETPQYFYDPKSNQVVVEYPTNGTYKVPCTGNLLDNQKDNKQQRQTNHNIGKDNTEIIYENGLETDIYSGEVMSSLTPEQRNSTLQNYYHQSTGQITLTQKIRATRTLNRQETERMDQGEEPERNVTRDRLEQLTRCFWLHIQMPAEFGYTSAGLLNNSFQGFLHTFIRHWDQWLQQIPELRSVMDDLAEIRDFLERVKNSDDRQSAGQAVNDFITALTNLSNQSSITIRSALLRGQLLIYRFMQRNMRSHNYYGEGVNGSGQVQVYFRVGNQIMVIGVSSELYPSVQEFDDSRPIRTITTVYFIEEGKLKNLFAGKAWKS